MGNTTTRTRYTCTCPSHGTLYSGYSESERDWHSNRPCPYCQNEANARAARDRAEKLRLKKARELEEIQRQERLAERERIEQERRDREAALLEARQKAEKEEQERIEALKEKLKADFNAQKKKFDNDHNGEKKKEHDDLLEQHKLDTLEMVKDIGERVKNCSAAGEEVVRYADNIQDTLKASLEDNYKIVEGEVDRYKKYGKEMRDINDLFVEELEKVLDQKFLPESDKIEEEIKV